MTAAPGYDILLDCTGALCPLPIVRLRQQLDKTDAGKVVRVIATDPASVQDMPAFARNTGHELLHATSSGKTYEFWFRKVDEEDGE